MFVLRYGIAAPGRQHSIRARRGNGRSAISRQPATACQYGMANIATVQPTTNDPLPTVNTNSRQRIENPRLCNRDQDLPITADDASAHAPSPVPATPRGGNAAGYKSTKRNDHFGRCPEAGRFPGVGPIRRNQPRLNRSQGNPQSYPRIRSRVPGKSGTRCAHGRQSVAARPKGPVRPEPVAPCRGSPASRSGRERQLNDQANGLRPGSWAKLGCGNVRRARTRQSRQPGDDPGIGGWARPVPVPVPRAQGVAAGRCARGRLRHPYLPGSVRGAMTGSVLQTCGGPDGHITELAN